MKILVADKISPKGVAYLRAQKGFEVVEAYGSSPAKVLELVKDVHAIAVRSETKITAEVIARAPAQLAPRTIPIDAISSSAWTIAYVAFPVALSIRYLFMYPMSASGNDEDGVMGYQATTVTPPNIAPSAAAVFPSIRIIPSVLSIRSM